MKINEILNELNPEFKVFEKFINTNILRLKKNVKNTPKFSEKQNILITYADQFQSGKCSSLENLKSFLDKELDNSCSHVHILPFYPWTSDDGFSSICFKQVASEYGTWEDITNIEQDKMFDCVFNHVSCQNEFFQKALKGSEKHQNMFHILSKGKYQSAEVQDNISKVVRPRTSPLFSKYYFNGEEKYVWTTFSKDQVDTNIGNVDMVHYILESLFLYIEKGATFFRIDAVPFMWKELGTNCSHLPKTHLFVKLLRAIVEEIGTNLLIITESNVPHDENITYWGNGNDEAHVIYNFSLAPLLLHALTFKQSKYITEWAKTVFDIGESVTYLNFTSTHDGIGMRGLEGIVSDHDVEKMCEIAKAKGGEIGKKRSRDGAIKPYELNCTWASFLKVENESEELFINKVVNSHALVMFFPGIGAHYVHNFFATLNWKEGYEESNIARRLNRKKFQYPMSETDIEKRVREGLVKLIKYKSNEPCFHPKASFEILDIDEKVISFIREKDGVRVQVTFNLTNSEVTIGDLQLKPYELKFNKLT